MINQIIFVYESMISMQLLLLLYLFNLKYSARLTMENEILTLKKIYFSALFNVSN